MWSAAADRLAELLWKSDAPVSLEEALKKTPELYYLGAVRMFRLIRTGMEIRLKLLTINSFFLVL